MTNLEQQFASFDKIVDMTYKEIQEALSGLEGHGWSIFKHWLSLCDTQRATYELERARVQIIRQRKPPATIEEAEAKLPIDEVLALWRNLIESIGGIKKADEYLIWAAFCGHYVR